MIPDRLLSRSDAQAAGFRDLSPLGALHHLGDLRLVDVREPDEYLGALGHIPGAELVPVSTVTAAAADWDRDAPVLLICRSGARSARAGTALAAMGFRNLYNLVGGMLAWDANGHPRVHDDDTPLARLAGQVHGFFVAAAGGDVEAGTRALATAAGSRAVTVDGLRRAIAALGSIEGVGADERAAWVAYAQKRLAEVV
jgi:rhodanese-related sulfurtransferase